MTTLGFPTYRDHLRSESHRFRQVLGGCDPTAPVPGCPDWDASDLLWHLAQVQWFWANLVELRPAGPDAVPPRPARPTTYDALLDLFDQHSAALVAALDSADPADPAWTWAEEQTVGFSYRRQAHEALIHRLDAEQTAGSVTALDPALAADGVAECLEIIYGGCPPWASLSPLPHHLRIEISDVHEAIWVRLGHWSGTNPDGAPQAADGIEVVTDPGVEPDAVLTGPADVLDTWLWRRGDDAQLEVSGDQKIHDRFRRALHDPDS